MNLPAGLAWTVLALVAGGAAAQPLTLSQALSHAEQALAKGDAGRVRYTVRQAEGAVRSAEGAFDWSAGASAGYARLYQPGSNAGFLTTDVQGFNVITSTVFAERRLRNGVRVRPGLLFTHGEDNFRPELARLGNRPQFEVDIPLDGSLGEPAEQLRLDAARSDLAAARTEAQSARHAYLHRVTSLFWSLLAAQERATVTAEYVKSAEAAAARVARLAGAGEVAASAAEEMSARAALGRAQAERDALDVLAARMQLADVLEIDPDRLAGAAAPFPDLAAAPSGSRLEELVARALDRRPDVRGAQERVETATLRARLAERETDSTLSLSLAHDRLTLNWLTPLGENRRGGARHQSMANLDAAESALAAARRRVRLETRLASERLAAASRAVERARAAVQRMEQRVALTGRLVDEGRAPHPALVDAAEQLASARRQWIDARLLHALALADLRLATATIPDEGAPVAELHQAFVTPP